MRSLTWPQVLAWRMRRQLLDPVGGPSGAVDAVTVTRRLAGVQAQVASAAALAVAVRGAPPDAAARALWEERTLLKTWAMRGTLHLLPVDQAGAYLALVATRRSWEQPGWQRTFGATPADLEAIAEVAARVLDGAVLTREQLGAAIVERTGSPHLAQVLASGWGPVLKPLAWWGVLCHGPLQGTRVTFTSPSGLPGWRGLPPVEEAARTVIRAFLGAHGPATPEVFDAWLTRGSSRKTAVRRWFAALAGELTTVEVDGVPLHLLAEHLDELLATEPSETVRLLGGFDQYVLGAGTDAAYLVPAARRAEVSRAAGWISPVVLYRGRVAGVWRAGGELPEVTLWEQVPRGALDAELARVQTLTATTPES
jgi:Winged helix DNA-binding domain